MNLEFKSEESKTQAVAIASTSVEQTSIFENEYPETETDRDSEVEPAENQKHHQKSLDEIITETLYQRSGTKSPTESLSHHSHSHSLSNLSSISLALSEPIENKPLPISESVSVLEVLHPEPSAIENVNPIPIDSEVLLNENLSVVVQKIRAISDETPLPRLRKLSWPPLSMSSTSFAETEPKQKRLFRRYSLQNAHTSQIFYDEEQIDLIQAQTMQILKKNWKEENDSDDFKDEENLDWNLGLNSGDYTRKDPNSESRIIVSEPKSESAASSDQQHLLILASSEGLTTKNTGQPQPMGGGTTMVQSSTMSNQMSGGPMVARTFDPNNCCSCDPPRRPRTPFPQPEGEVPYQNEVPRYCESIPPGVSPSPMMIGDMIKDLSCVFEKTFGQRKDMESRYRSIQCEFEELEKAFEKSECCKEQLRQEIACLQAELRAAQYAFQEEAERRAGLETMVNQLRAQLNRLMAQVEADAIEKARLNNIIRELEQRIKQMQSMIDMLTAENMQLKKNCTEFGEWRNKHVDNLNLSKGRCGQLEDSLEKCCRKNEELQREISSLRKELDCLKSFSNQSQNERRQMGDEFERERQRWLQERAALEQAILDLKKALECLTEQNTQICQKTNEIVAAHHAEMDQLKAEAEKYRMLYECEKAQREKLERALEDCEERKREMLMQQQQAQMRSSYSYNTNPPCSEMWPQFGGQSSQPRGGGGQSNGPSDNSQAIAKANAANQELKSKLETANGKITGLEKDLQYKDQCLEEVSAAHNKAKTEVEALNNKSKALEKEVARASEEVTHLREQLQNNELNTEAVQELLTRKVKVEKELQKLKKVLKERYVDRDDVERWKAAYEAKINSLKAAYTAAAEIQINEKLAEYKTYLDRQTRDRTVIEELREANESALRSEYSQVTNSMKSDLSKLKAIVREREEEISSLKLSITHLKNKYSSEANMKEELLKQLAAMAASRTSLTQDANANSNAQVK